MSDRCGEAFNEARCTKDVGHDGVHYADLPWGRARQYSAGVAWPAMSSREAD